jgi:hypothetical protein
MQVSSFQVGPLPSRHNQTVRFAATQIPQVEIREVLSEATTSAVLGRNEAYKLSKKLGKQFKKVEAENKRKFSPEERQAWFDNQRQAAVTRRVGAGTLAQSRHHALELVLEKARQKQAVQRERVHA